MTPIPNLVDQAQARLGAVLQPGDCAIDATVGRGSDTLFLARAVGPRGRVWGFDVQQQALAEARQRLAAAGLEARVRWRLSDHSKLDEVLPSKLRGRIRVAMFNLGYLPRGDPAVTTRPGTTVTALDACLQWLRDDGLLSVIAYTGHPGGLAETRAVGRWAGQLDPTRWRHAWNCPPSPGAPRWLLVTGLGGAGALSDPGMADPGMTGPGISAPD